MFDATLMPGCDDRWLRLSETQQVEECSTGLEFPNVHEEVTCTVAGSSD